MLGNPLSLPVEAILDPAGRWDTLLAGGLLVDRSKQKIALQLRVNSARPPEEFLRTGLDKEALSVLVHEATHVRDVIRMSDISRKLDDEYYNSPHEVRAYMQQVAHEVLYYVEELARRVGVGPWGVRLQGDLVEDALSTSHTWGAIKNEMSPANRNLVLKGVARALQDEWPRLKKAYPSEDDD